MSTGDNYVARVLALREKREKRKILGEKIYTLILRIELAVDQGESEKIPSKVALEEIKTYASQIRGWLEEIN